VFLIVNAALGAGLLDFPHAFHQAGKFSRQQGCGSASGSGSAWIRIRIRFRMDPHEFELLDPDLDHHSKYESGSRRAKMAHKNRKKVKNFHVLKCWMFSFEG
jgi:hypothetical protein